MPVAESVHIVGWQGRMGSMLAKRLQEAGYRVSGSDQNQPATPAADALILVCVPPGVLPEVLRDLAPVLRPQQLLMDITSVKTLPMAWMEAAHSGPVVGSHPLFGPLPRQADLRVALVAGSKADQAACARAEALFNAIGCTCFWTSAEEHDRQTGLTQSLNFGINAAFFSLLAESGLQPEFMTPSCRRLLDAARKILTEDRAMFLEFSALNPQFPDIVRDFRQRLDLDDPSGFARLAHQAGTCYSLSEPSDA